MEKKRAFKRPTIKETNRAYVRLYEYFNTPEKWLAFLERYRVEIIDFGMRRHGDCAIRVIDPETQEVAVLGLELPNTVKYHTYVATSRSFWNEEFASATHRRIRTIEVGDAQASKDEVAPR